ncbi:hypothetical protein ACOMHN_006953 [Nucella lapillus]
MTASLFSHPLQYCRYSPNRSEEEVVRCLNYLAQRILKMQAKWRRRHPYGWRQMSEGREPQEDPFETTNQDGFVRSRDTKTSREDSGMYEKQLLHHLEQLHDPHHPQPQHDPSRQNQKHPRAVPRPQPPARPKYFKSRRVTRVSSNLSLSALREIKDRFKQRRVVLEKACGKYKHSGLFKPLEWNPFVLPDSSSVGGPGVAYCPIPKTGSTTWFKVLHAIRRDRMGRYGKSEKRQALSLTDLTIRNESSNVMAENLNNLVNFVFVREPYSRLLSGYVDKLFSPNPYFWRDGRYIVQHFRKNPSSQSLACGHDVTFAEFVRYVLYLQKRGGLRDAHFAPIHDQCHFCNVSYDYVGNLETLGQDMTYLLHVLQSSMNYSGPFEEDTLNNNAMWVFRKMREDILACMTMEEAGRRLWRKWQIRGLVNKAELFTFTGQGIAHARQKKFVAAGLAAIQRSGGLSRGKNQKAEALREAYTSVPISDRLHLREMFFLDFELFGFDPDLSAVFAKNESVSKSNFSYFAV